MMRFRLFFIARFSVLVGALLVIGCDRPERESDRVETPAPAVEALEARSGALPLEERLSGVVKARNQVAIRTEINAPIVEVLVENGAAVERGQALVRLADDTLRERFLQSQASLRLAEASAAEARARVAEVEAQVVRTRSLAAQELVSELDLETQEARLAAALASSDQAAARVDQARATRDERRAALDKTLVRSPVAGRLGQRNAEIGMLATTNSVLFVVGDLKTLIVEVPLTEAMMAYVREGMTARITPSASGEAPTRAPIRRISPFLAAGSFSTVGEIDVDNPDGRLHPGMFVRVDVLYGESERATLVPSSAVWEDSATGLRGVYVVEVGAEPPTGDEVESHARPVAFRPVEVLAEGRGAVGLAGIRSGEWVVTMGQHLLGTRKAEAARVRATTWERVLELQGLQREDLLRGFLDKQQRIARTQGAEPPSSRQFLQGS